MGHEATSRAGQQRGSAMGAHYRHTTPVMATRIATAIERRLTVVLRIAEQALEAQPNRSTRRVSWRSRVAFSGTARLHLDARVAALAAGVAAPLLRALLVAITAAAALVRLVGTTTRPDKRQGQDIPRWERSTDRSSLRGRVPRSGGIEGVVVMLSDDARAGR
jgi:hypothetical protein